MKYEIVNYSDLTLHNPARNGVGAARKRMERALCSGLFNHCGGLDEVLLAFRT
jgi:hypothetical protein